ncbi:uncharacterized protein N7479_009663 [Penicillium vulpinum]|uniref:MYND-type domain-containing protein n=1 Tax=Penicillium vulpinum TaxID=29845 RepID=A0A1V6RFY3_9EURO|nr:uncharacterized protein N7479_009663 [Penicillium vulpinum]KAJ5951250.1 hypothetical protein N7479_009663 [Penicillium vulpinum]OQE00440.1 hypothetical protein PENVUL_c052G08348 [Penicillium vulpinum]
MGRWGWRLFEGDQDLDAVLLVTQRVESMGVDIESWEHSLSSMVHQTDMLAPAEAIAIYSTAGYAASLANVTVPYIRKKLDTDKLGERLFAATRAKERVPEDLFQKAKYSTIIVGALMMRAGACIKEADLQHLRDLVPQINCTSRRTMWEDHGFRSPGKAQFLAALDHYEPGVARSFQEPSCFKCGRIEADIGHKPLQCKKCKVATYCGKDCQRAQWREHRVSCIHPAQRRVLNI